MRSRVMDNTITGIQFTEPHHHGPGGTSPNMGGVASLMLMVSDASAPGVHAGHLVILFEHKEARLDFTQHAARLLKGALEVKDANGEILTIKAALSSSTKAA